MNPHCKIGKVTLKPKYQRKVDDAKKSLFKEYSSPTDVYFDYRRYIEAAQPYSPILSVTGIC